MAEQNLNGLATVYNDGVWSTECTARMRARNTSPLSNEVIPGSGGDVSLVSFRTVLDRAGGTIDLLKIDCEGAEWTFMNDPEMFRRVHAIRMEYHLDRGNTLQNVRELALRLGYEITRLRETSSNFGILWLDRDPKRMATN
jgi:hypothetical protein